MTKRKASEMEKQSFTVQCPAKPASSQTASRKRAQQDVFIANDTPGPTELQIDYSIKPGNEWGEMRRYKNVKYQERDFPVDSYILVNHTYPPPSPPPADAPLEQILDYQRTNMWVGKIREAKAQNEHRVFLRVFWLYWPEELPGGAQGYHGQQELVLSNHVEVVEATTISGHAEVSHWDEEDEDDEKPLFPLFWRQTLDLKPGTNGKPTLSALRKHCICRQEYNPDRTMFKCAQDSCGVWNHKECLEKDLEESLKLKLRKNALHSHLDRRAADWSQEQQDKEKDETETELVPAGDENGIVTKSSKSGEDLSSLPPTTAKANARSPPKHNPKEDKLQVSVQEFQGKSRGTVVALVRLLPAKRSGAEVKEWTIKLNCLKCSHPLE